MALDPAMNNESVWKKYVPFLTPAVKKDSFEPDQNLLSKRVAVIGLAIFAALGTAIYLGAPIFVGVPLKGQILFAISSLASTILGLIDSYLTGKSLDERAASDYPRCGNHLDLRAAQEMDLAAQELHMRAAQELTIRNFPIINHIAHNFSAAKLLVQKENHLQSDFDLKSFFSDFEIFKYFIDNNAVVKPEDYKQLCKSPEALRYLVEINRISHNDLKPHEFAVWQSIDDEKFGEFLKKNGFNVDCRDIEDYTPLMRLVENYAKLFLPSERTTYLKSIKVLLACGADVSLTLLDKNGLYKTVDQLTQNPTIKALLAPA